MSERKRVVFCTYPSLYSLKVLEQLLEAPNIEVVAVFCSTRHLKKKNTVAAAAWQMLCQSGFYYLWYYFLLTDVAVWCSYFSPKGGFYRRLKRRGIALQFGKDINASEHIHWIQSYTPDYLLAAHFNQKVGASLLQTEDFTCLNIHPSLLPAYQGVDPVFYALLRAESQVGVSLHVMDAAFDQGELLSQSTYCLDTVEKNEVLSFNVMDVSCSLFTKGASLFVDWVQKQEPVNVYSVNYQPQPVCVTELDTRQQSNKEVLEPVNGEYDSWPAFYLVHLFHTKGFKLYRIRSFIAHVLGS